MSDPRVSVDGDAASGWLVDIHDGNVSAAYSPEAATADEAKEKALAMHAESAALTRQAEETNAALVATLRMQVGSLQQMVAELRDRFHAHVEDLRARLSAIEGRVPQVIDHNYLLPQVVDPDYLRAAMAEQQPKAQSALAEAQAQATMEAKAGEATSTAYADAEGKNEPDAQG